MSLLLLSFVMQMGNFVTNRKIIEEKFGGMKEKTYFCLRFQSNNRSTEIRQQEIDEAF
jgi:hypothetical protein